MNKLYIIEEDDVMQGIKKEELRESIEDYLKILFRKDVEEASKQQIFQAVS